MIATKTTHTQGDTRRRRRDRSILRAPKPSAVIIVALHFHHLLAPERILGRRVAGGKGSEEIRQMRLPTSCGDSAPTVPFRDMPFATRCHSLTEL
jgi:hypothetical protein